LEWTVKCCEVECSAMIYLVEWSSRVE